MEEDYKEMSVGQIRQEYHRGIQLVEEGSRHISRAGKAIEYNVERIVCDINHDGESAMIEYAMSDDHRFSDGSVARWVRNTPAGVTVEINGNARNFNELTFEDRLGILNALMNERY